MTSKLKTMEGHEKQPVNGLLMTTKQTRLSGSCDFCRKRKIKCDSAMMPNNVCSNCAHYNKSCTHEFPVLKQRGIRNSIEQIAELEQKVQELEDALRACDNTAVVSLESVPPAYIATSEDPEVDEEYVEMLSDLKRFSLSSNNRYFGPSSNINFIFKMLDSTPNMNGSLTRSGSGKKWTMHPWEAEILTIPRRQLIFPETDLLEHLVDVYFSMAHFYPILHEPSFRRDLKAGLHRLDDSFAFVVLLVCALGSIGTTDPRVLMDGASKQSAGWKYFAQTMSLPRPMFSCPTIHDVQYCVLYISFCVGTSTPHANWTMLGIGVRYAIELGYHRRHHGNPTIESELRKRAFWCLVYLDRGISLYFGRPCSIRDEDFDLDLPIDCDDEYMSTGDPATDFKQPPNKPAHVAVFIHQIRLVNIMSTVIKTIYGTRKSKLAAGCKTGSDDNIVAILDSMLNAWFNDIPSHLRWDHIRTTPYSVEPGFLYIAYYDLQIFVHRPFIHTNTPQAFLSTAICTNAARTVSRIMETVQARQSSPYFGLEMTAFSAGMILVTNIRNRRHLNPLQSQSAGGHDLEDLHRCMRILGSSEVSYSISGRLRHTLEVLADLSTLGADSEPAPTHPSSSVAAASGYADNPAPDISELDPTLFGLLPPKQDIWPRFVKPDMSLFDVEQDVNVWSDAATVESLPYWTQDMKWSADGRGGLLDDEAVFGWQTMQ